MVIMYCQNSKICINYSNTIINAMPIVLCLCIFSLYFYVYMHMCTHFVVCCSCWLSTKEGTIFGFVVPMLLIILVRHILSINVAMIIFRKICRLQYHSLFYFYCMIMYIGQCDIFGDCSKGDLE